MRTAIVSHLAAAALVLSPVAAYGGDGIQIDVLYMNHGPLAPTLEELRSVTSHYGKRVAVAWHDSETDEGRRFMAEKKLTGHIPLVIWVNGSPRQQVAGREVNFTGFPTGSGPAPFQGKWSMADLRQVLDRLAAEK